MPLAGTYEDNISNLQPKNDYGLKIAKAGFDALTAADNDLLFNSSWPSVQYSQVRAVTKTAETFTPVAHGLGFPPVAFVMGGSDYQAVMQGCSVDDTYVYVATAFQTGSVGDTMGTLVIYDIDISVDVEYPYTATSSGNIPYDPNYGIKVVKGDGDIESTDLRDFILHSRCGSPLVLAVKTQETVNPNNPDVVQYTSRLGYPTLNFGYSGRPAGTTVGNITFGSKGYQFAPQGGQSIPITSTDGFTASTPIYDNFSDGRASIVCLRSPMFAITNTQEVTI